MKILFTALFTLLLCSTMQYSYSSTQNINSTKGIKTMVKLHTNHGIITLQLDAEKAPITVKNFLEYVNSGFYNGTIFHRVIGNFMIQGGGFQPGMIQKKTNAPIKNEAANGLKNDKYTVAMARTGDPQSATAQFFINVKDNELPQLSRAGWMGLLRVRQSGGRQGSGGRDTQRKDRKPFRLPGCAIGRRHHHQGGSREITLSPSPVRSPLPLAGEGLGERVL